MFFTREDREKLEAQGPVEYFAAQIEHRYGLHGRRKELAADIQAFLDSQNPAQEPAEPEPTEPTEGGK